MSNLDKYFDSDIAVATHPRIPAWAAIIDNKPSYIACVIHRRREGLGFLPTKIYIQYKITSDSGMVTDCDDWDDGLNQFLLENGIKAKTVQNEGLRFNIILGKLLQNIEIRYGEGYFNAVLLEVIQASFGTDLEIAEMLKKVGLGNPHKGRSYSHVLSSIEGAIKQCADRLVVNLGYTRPEADAVLIIAMKEYMDERFSITNLKILGWD